MRKVAAWLAVISFFVFVIAWGIGGLMIYNGEYENNAWTYVGLVSIVVGICSLLCLKNKKCPHCGKMNQTSGKFCPYCGKEIN